MPFSMKTKHEIYGQQGGVVLPKDDGTPREYAHLNHDKRKPTYDVMDNGVYVNITTHRQMHSDGAELAKRKIEEGGGSFWKWMLRFHTWSIQQIERRMQKMNIPVVPPEYLDNK